MYVIFYYVMLLCQYFNFIILLYVPKKKTKHKYKPKNVKLLISHSDNVRNINILINYD